MYETDPLYLTNTLDIWSLLMLRSMDDKKTILAANDGRHILIAWKLEDTDSGL